MTVKSTTRKQTYAGGTGTFVFTFRALTSAPTDIKVKKTLISSGAETDLTYTTDYTAAINSDGVGGTVTVSPTVSTLYTVTVYRDTTDKQESDYDDYNQFPADTLETDFDRRTMVSQETSEDIDRTLKLSITYTGSSLTIPNPQADKLLGWDSDGEEIENKSFTSTNYAGTISRGNESARPASPTVGDIYVALDTETTFVCYTAGTWDVMSTAEAGIECVFDGGGSAITTNSNIDIEVPFACTLKSATLLANTTGSITVDIWKDTYANYPPTDADTIVSNSSLLISASTQGVDSTLAGWTTSFAKGDVLRFNVDSCTDIERCLVSLKVEKA